MKTTVHSCLNQMYKLVIDEPLKAAKDRAVLARIVLDEGTGCWSVEDIRLSPRGRASPYFKVSADHYCATMDAITEQEASVMRYLLRDFKESPRTDRKGAPLLARDGTPAQGASFNWCTYNGLRAGRASVDVSGRHYTLANGAALYHSRKDALSHLREIAQFWAVWPHSETEADIIEKASALKIDNPMRQPSATTLLIDVRMRIEKLAEEDRQTESNKAIGAPSPLAPIEALEVADDEQLCTDAPSNA